MSDTIAPAAKPTIQPTSVTSRLTSLDALRGFDMFWIVGGEELIHALHKGWPCAFTDFLRGQINHKDWAGVAFYDLIFPLFVFIVGASLVFSLGKTMQQAGTATALKRIFLRSLALYIFGLLVYGGLSKGFDQIRWLGVLQRIALCYFFTGLIFCAFRLRGMVVVWATLLLGYWAVTALVPVRDFNLEKRHLASLNLKPEDPATRVAFLATTNWVRDRYDDGLNVTQHIDFRYLPGFKWDGAYDPEGLLSTFPAIATCLLGVFAGLFLKNGTATPQKKVIWLIGAGAAGVVLGFLWGTQFPVIKKIWTSSYVLVAGGYACLLLAAFYQAVEIQGWRKWCVPFVWIGMNPITIYLAFHLINFSAFAQLVVGGPVQEFLGPWGAMAQAVVVVGMVLALVRFLYQRKIFLRV
jgi:predicted acyltransferase